MTRLIAFTGPAGCGKSTASDALVACGWQRVKFAGPLKDMMRALGFTEAHIEGHLKEQPSDLLLGRTPRHAMQTLGTEWGRECIGPDFWTGLAARRIAAALNAGVSVVVDDCRFANEAEVIRGLGGKVVRIEGRGGIGGSHASEAFAFDPDMVVRNDSARAETWAGLVRHIFHDTDV